METPNSVRAGWVVSCVGARANAFRRVQSGRVVLCHAWVLGNMWPCKKMLRLDHPCASCTFAQPVCATLHHAFVQVVHPWKSQISFGRVGSCRAWMLGHT